METGGKDSGLEVAIAYGSTGSHDILTGFLGIMIISSKINRK